VVDSEVGGQGAEGQVAEEDNDTEHAVSALLELIAHYHELLTNRASLERRLSIAEAQMKVRREQVKTLEKQTGSGRSERDE
jgi:hypothetical protein